MQQGAENEDSLENRKDTWQLKSVFIADGADSKLENMKKKKQEGKGEGWLPSKGSGQELPGNTKRSLQVH